LISFQNTLEEVRAEEIKQVRVAHTERLTLTLTSCCSHFYLPPQQTQSSDRMRDSAGTPIAATPVTPAAAAAAAGAGGAIAVARAKLTGGASARSRYVMRSLPALVAID
jgi:hypothetical protein